MGFRYWSESEKAPLVEMIREHGVEEVVNQLCEIADAMGRPTENPHGTIKDLEKRVKEAEGDAESADDDADAAKESADEARFAMVELLASLANLTAPLASSVEKITAALQEAKEKVAA